MPTQDPDGNYRIRIMTYGGRTYHLPQVKRWWGWADLAYETSSYEEARRFVEEDKKGRIFYEYI